MRFHRIPLMMLAVCSLLLPASVATAQQSSPEGVVLLGHRAKARNAAKRAHKHRPSAAHCDGCGTGYGGGYGYGSGHGYGHGSCRHYSAAGINGGRHGYGSNPHYSHCGVGHWLNKLSPYHRCTLPPDHGWAPPAHRPMRPTPAMYSRMFPSQWTGEESGIDPGFRHPQIYMPTDTTQLGYYYQQVPFWRSRPNMIPPVPNPDEWHTPDLGVVFTGFEDAAACSLEGGCPTENVIDHGMPFDQGLPTYGSPIQGPIESSPIQSLPMQSQPIEGTPIPMFEANPAAPYSPEPVIPQLVPPAVEPALVPPVPTETVPPAAPPVAPPAAPAAPELEKSASLPLLIPVPPQ